MMGLVWEGTAPLWVRIVVAEEIEPLVPYLRPHGPWIHDRRVCVWLLQKVSYGIYMAGPERIELPPHGSKPRILSIELKAESGALNVIQTRDLSLTKGVLYR